MSINLKINPSNLLYSVFLLYIITDMFQAPIRFLLALMSADALFYIPKLLLIISCFYNASFLRVKHSIVLVATLFFYCLYTTLVSQNIFQSIYFLSVISAFLFLLSYKSVVDRFARNSTLLWILLLGNLAGLIYEMNFEPLWRGMIVGVGNKGVEISRYWTSSGVIRYSGFSKASFELAAWVCLLAALLLNKNSFKGIQSAIVICVASYIIYASNTKVLIVTLSLVFLFYGLINRVLPRNFDKILPLAAISIVILLPILSLIGFANAINQSLTSNIFSSFVIRFEDTWPNSFALLRDLITQLFGLGLGGIGSVQAKLQPDLYSPGDNLFVYLYCTFGLFSIVVFGYLFYIILRSNYDALYYRAILTLVLLFGVTANVIESSGAMIMFAYSILNIDSRRKV